jgi:sorting nexin-29
MLHLGIPGKPIKLTKMTMKTVQCSIKIQNDISEQLETNKGLWQGDTLACLLFNVVLEKVMRDTIYKKSIQVLAYADDINIIGCYMRDTTEVFTKSERPAEEFGLQVNESKTKCMVVSTSEARRNRTGQNLTIGEYNFEVVKEFSYLGSKVNCINNINGKIHNRILLADRAYYCLRNLLTSRSVFRKKKRLLYKTLILPVALYASETWPLTKKKMK